MTKQLSDLFDSFTAMGPERQLEKIRQIRYERSIVRPAVAKREQKKKEKTSRSAKDKVAGMMSKLSPEARAALIEKLKGDLDG